jgi:MoaA/NifB/PqqE/SkfB family radical SAM enzyme
MYLDRFAPQGSTIVLTGGEPMTVPYFGTLIRMLVPHYEIVIETNGSQLFKLPKSIDYSNTRLLIAWHPKMITWEKFHNNIKQINFPWQCIRLMQIATYNNGERTIVNDYPQNIPFPVILNDGAMPDFGVPINEPLMFVRPNGKVMSCASSQAKCIGDIYEGTLDESNLNGCRNCTINGLVWCNSLKNVYLAFEGRL